MHASSRAFFQTTFTLQQTSAGELLVADEGLEAYSKRTDLTPFAPNGLGLFALQLRFDIVDEDELADAITDGKNDKKCDLFYIDDELRTAVIVQSYESLTPKETPPINKATDLHAAASWLIGPGAVGEMNAQMASASAELRSAIEDGDVDTIEFWFVHNSPDNPQVISELEQVATTASALLRQVYGDEVGGNINCVGRQVGATTFDQLWARRTQQVRVDDTFDVPVTEFMIEDGKEWRAAYATVPGSWLKALHDKYGPGDLFSGNVRDFLGTRGGSSVNQSIQRTARDRPGDFWPFNNGVTALVSAIEMAEAGQLKVRGITIVNGAQTTGALSGVDLADDARVLIRFVECANKELIQEIIRANNTQNEILASDFRSYDACQTRLRSEFASIPQAHYTGARRGELVAGHAAPDDSPIPADLAAQSLAAFHAEPHRAYHAKGRIWADDAIYGRFFSDRTTAAHIVFVTSLVRAVNEYKARLRGKAERTGQEDAALTFLSQRGATFLLAAAIGHCQEQIVGKAINDRFALSFGGQVSPTVAVELWTGVVESLTAFHAALQPAAESGKIRVEAERVAALNAFRAQVSALLSMLETTVFSGIRPHIVT
jgi:hypothetical protein